MGRGACRCAGITLDRVTLRAIVCVLVLGRRYSSIACLTRCLQPEPRFSATLAAVEQLHVGRLVGEWNKSALQKFRKRKGVVWNQMRSDRQVSIVPVIV